VGLILEAAERHDHDAALARVIAERFDRAIQLGHGDEDMAACYWATAPKERQSR
jgi:3-hydroxyisobutyrate dehydrogenase-like beta-hydroxyacid dehydrogenase